MLKIAVCDDNRLDAGNLEKMTALAAEANGVQFQMDCFENGKDLLECIQVKEYDLIFLDIEMGRENGLEIARQIREENETVLLIYVTNYEKYAVEAYETLPFRYIVKPVNESIFQKYFLQAYEKIQEGNFFYEYRCRGHVCRVRVSQIIYFESRKRKICIHLKNGEELAFYDRLNHVEESLKTQKAVFWRIHQSFLVNAKYVIRKNHDSVVLLNGVRLPISEERRRKISMSYFETEEREMRK